MKVKRLSTGAKKIMIQNGKRNMNLQFGTAQHEMEQPLSSGSLCNFPELCSVYIPTGINFVHKC